MNEAKNLESPVEWRRLAKNMTNESTHRKKNHTTNCLF